MSNRNTKKSRAAAFKSASTLLIGLFALGAAGCSGPSDGDGTVANAIVLPTDVVLDLACADAGINDEQCVLLDPENPYVNIKVSEFDVNNPNAVTKFDLNALIPPGPEGAKARFYLWATALARSPSGENQWYTARALHELWDANGDELIRDQAIRAYRSVLDNFFGSVTFFTFGGATTSRQLNAQVADDLFRPAATGFRVLIEGGERAVLEVLTEWGYTYIPANPPNYDDGVVSVNIG
ncbi:MAG: hypothetical protein QNI99_12530 [Woeseiaceae bacterium]|nr:hypothetical protein [Woeseiaceae bacterium]